MKNNQAMKNPYNIILITASMLFSIVTFSQDIIILDENLTDVTNGEIIIYGEPTDLIIKAEIFFQNTSDVELPVLVRKIEVDVFPGTLNTFCWNGSCLSDQTFEVDNPIVLAAGATSRENDFYAEYMPEGLSVTSIIKYEFFAPDDEFETVGVTVHYITGDDDDNGDDPNNIAIFDAGKYSFNSLFPNPANEYTQVSYDIPFNSQNAVVQVISITGKVLIEEKLNPSGSTHIIDTGFLQRGVYMISLSANGHIISTRKLVVSK